MYTSILIDLRIHHIVSERNSIHGQTIFGCEEAQITMFRYSGRSNIELAMSKKILGNVQTHSLVLLSLGLVKCCCESQTQRELVAHDDDIFEHFEETSDTRENTALPCCGS